jgi:hypothetical protein
MKAGRIYAQNATFRVVEQALRGKKAFRDEIAADDEKPVDP